MIGFSELICYGELVLDAETWQIFVLFLIHTSAMFVLNYPFW
jgi:hypothetical protein